MVSTSSLSAQGELQLNTIQSVLSGIADNVRVIDDLVGRTGQILVDGAGSWTVEFYKDSVDVHVSRKSDYPQHDFYVTVSRKALEEFLVDPLNIWDVVFSKSFGSNKPVMAAMMLESFYPGVAEKVVSNRLDATHHYGKGITVETFFQRILPDLLAQPKFMRRIKASYDFRIEGAGEWHLDTSADARAVRVGLGNRAKCTVTATREDFEEFLNDPIQIAPLISKGRIKVSHPCRARQLLAAVWMPDIKSALGSDLVNQLFAADSCEEAARGESHYTYVEYTPGGIAKIHFVDVGGKAIWQGDIEIGETEELVAMAKQFEESRKGDQKGGVEGIRIINWGNPSQYVWPNKTLYYQIDSDVEDQDRITDAIAYFSDTSITFENSTGSGNYVKIKKGDECSSKVGMQGGVQDVVLSDSCSVGSIAHELCHALGLWHEQSRHDRDDYVTIEWCDIEEGMAYNFDMVTPSVDAYTTLAEVISRTATPPASPADGDRYLVGENATGAWAGRDNDTAQWDSASNSWTFTAPASDNLVRLTSSNTAFAYNGTQWVNVTTQGQDIGDYDYSSIMHYSSRAFGKKETTCKKKVTIETKGGESIGQRDKLSDGDKAALKEIYG